MTTEYVHDKRKSVLTSNCSTLGKLAKMQEMFNQKPQKSTRQAARESEMTRHSIVYVLPQTLNYLPRKPHHAQELNPEDCDRRI